MGIKESKIVCQEIVGVDGPCVPLAIIESLPEGFPSLIQLEGIIPQIVALVDELRKSHNEILWIKVIEMFWQEKTPSDLQTRDANDPAMLEILRYVYENKLPIIAIIPVGNWSHAVGVRFVETGRNGVIAEFIDSYDGENPFIPINGSRPHDVNGFLKSLFESGQGKFVIFPPLDYATKH